MAQVTATDADDPMFGNNAKLIYSILQGEPYFSVEPKTGTWTDTGAFRLNSLAADIMLNFTTSGLIKDTREEMFLISGC